MHNFLFLSALRICAVSLATLFLSRSLKAQEVGISEIMTSNATTPVPGASVDQFDDWIELHNPGATDVELVGWHLTDDEDVPFKWTFPSLVIPAGGYRVVFASGNGVASNGVPHTNFSLSSSSGYLALVRPDLSVSSSFDYAKQFTDVSYGIPAGGGGEIRFVTATPGSVNGSAEYLYVEDTQFDKKRGYYSQPISVVVTSATANAVIRYTLDGSEPQESGNGQTYNGAIPITTTTVLRARAYLAGHAPTNIDTQTYIYPDAVLDQTRPSGYPTSWGSESNADYDMDSDISRSSTYQTRLLEGLRDLPTLSLASETGAIFGSSGIYSRDPGQ